MRLARHALSSRLLAETSCGTSPKLYRNRSAITHRSKPKFRRYPREATGWSKEDNDGPSLGSRPGLSSYRTKKLNYSERQQFVSRENFIPWLISRLELLIRKFADNGDSTKAEEKMYSTFLTNLLPVLKSVSTWHALGSIDPETTKPLSWQPTEQSRPLSLFKSLKAAFIASGEAGVDSQLRYSYNGLLASRTFSKIDLEDQEELADLRYPTEWYPATREMQRTIHLHVGPTNSGKTYHALKRLEQAQSGIYAGPLRLLAHEVYTRLNAQGKLCDLVTGDEQVYKDAGEGPRMMSCTVEMVPLNTNVEVAVIDEIQMIGDRDRGWAWTQALLGIKAKEIHLCGEERTVPLIRELAASMGDHLEVHTYKRLSPLKTMSTSLQGDLKNLRKGDCVVVFSKVGIHAMKKQIEQLTEKRVAIVYGSLPPEVRAQQATLFNDPENDYDILVASDAIGMGLNLAIKRIIFETVTKFNGAFFETIHPSQIKQIAGRAGRFRTAPPVQSLARGTVTQENLTDRDLLDSSAPPSNLGLVTALEEQELPVVRKAMQNEAEPIMTAGLFPPTSALEKFATYFPPLTSFSYILLRLQELSMLHPRFHICNLRDQVGIADIIQPVRGLSIHDRIIFCAAPANTRDPGIPVVLAAYARCVGDNASGELLDIPEIPFDVLDEEIRLDREYLSRLESLHKALVLYLWLSYRFVGVFVSQSMGFYVKKMVETRIDNVLVDFSASPAIKNEIQRMKKTALKQVQKLNEMDQQSGGSRSERCGTVEEPLMPVSSSEEKSLKGEHQGPAFQFPDIEPEAGEEDDGEATPAG